MKISEEDVHAASSSFSVILLVIIVRMCNYVARPGNAAYHILSGAVSFLFVDLVSLGAG